MFYISICLNAVAGPGGSSNAPADATIHSGVSFQSRDRLHFMSLPLRDYVLDEALDHFRYLGPSLFKSALHDISMLAEDIQRHFNMWDCMCISAGRAIGSTNPSWPMARHDLLLYILVAFAPNSLLSRSFCTPLRPKEGTNPLVYAACFNKGGHARTLLLQGARLNYRGWETDGSCQSLPIKVAFQNRHYNMVTLFEGSTIPPYIFTDSVFNPDETEIPFSVARVLVQTDEFAEDLNSPNEPILRSMNISNRLLRYWDKTSLQ